MIDFGVLWLVHNFYCSPGVKCLHTQRSCVVVKLSLQRITLMFQNCFRVYSLAVISSMFYVMCMLSFITLFPINVRTNLFELKINYFILMLKLCGQLALEQPARRMVALHRLDKESWGKEEKSNRTVFLKELQSSNRSEGSGHRILSANMQVCCLMQGGAPGVGIWTAFTKRELMEVWG